MLRPERSHQRELQPLRLPDLRDDTLEKAEGREGISLETIPRLHHRIRARRLWIVCRREVDQKAMVQRRGKQVNRRWPQTKEIPESRKTKGPFRPQDLRLTTEGVRQDVQATQNELRDQPNQVSLAKPQDSLSYGVEEQKTSAPLVPQVSQNGGVVRKQTDGPMPEKREETLNPVQNRKELPVVDREAGTRARPRAGDVVVAEGGTSTGVQGVSEQRQIGGPEGKHPSGPEKPSNPQDAEIGGPTVGSPCENGTPEQTG